MENNIETHFTDKFGLVDPLLGKSDYRMGYESGFINGAKWQAERMYSEEEVLNLLSKFREDLVNCIGHKGLIGHQKWFEQFKKKS